ncbi:major facilitator superfamily transporter [Colletotrichum tofieldiae]|nr:major facilitator superfamily transporter [Colletotrichum tofieldiae]GKT71507.1 major facilitator superfamily transporter [Colletotrichum tofieldiae]GKT95335.1 major facilitator superfamily transporter [Colletotrichum tofieldiae]
MSAPTDLPPEKALETPANDTSGADSPSEIEAGDEGVNTKTLLRKLDAKLLPAVGILIPCNIILKRTTPRFWLPTLTIAWGIVATLMGIVTNMAGFFVARFFLGVTESGLFPGVVYYFSMWYKRRERQYRISLFFSAASLAGAFGGILAWASHFQRTYLDV